MTNTDLYSFFPSPPLPSTSPFLPSPSLFFSPVHCSFSQVTFRNEKTNEYLFYNIHFKATPPGIISSIDLSTPVRKSVSHRVTIDNPMPTQVTFHTNVNTLDISLPATFEAGAESEVSRGRSRTVLAFSLPLRRPDHLVKMSACSNLFSCLRKLRSPDSCTLLWVGCLRHIARRVAW